MRADLRYGERRVGREATDTSILSAGSFAGIRSTFIPKKPTSLKVDRRSSGPRPPLAGHSIDDVDVNGSARRLHALLKYLPIER